jgi:hypothetical protein
LRTIIAQLRENATSRNINDDELARRLDYCIVIVTTSGITSREFAMIEVDNVEYAKLVCLTASGITRKFGCNLATDRLRE